MQEKGGILNAKHLVKFAKILFVKNYKQKKIYKTL